MIVYENFFFKLSENFLSKGRLEKKFLIDNHYKTIFGSIRMACSSYTVYWDKEPVDLVQIIILCWFLWRHHDWVHHFSEEVPIRKGVPTYYLSKIFQKLHGNEENFTGGGGGGGWCMSKILLCGSTTAFTLEPVSKIGVVDLPFLPIA